MSEGFALYDEDERLVLCNERYRQSFPTLAKIDGLIVPGMKFENFVRTGAERGLILTARGRVEEHVQERLEKFRNPAGPTEFQQPRGNWIRFQEKKIASGGTVCIRSDVTDFRLAEEKLHQAQKMEMVGQLTGGMAHDFNNLLGVIIGNLDFLADGLQDNTRLFNLVEKATKAALIGASLNRQLLAFSRKQTLSPQVIDLNDHVSGMLDMLRRTLGETIEVVGNLSPDSWKTKVDPEQLESALLNLADNARDAMPGGGILTIETGKVLLDSDYVAARSEVAPGDYVMLTVRDTGTGMPPEVMGQVFDPFFTTKEVGKGSGLGLSMVFGFAKQSDGHAEIESEEGVGTTVKLYLPYAQQSTSGREEKAADLSMARGETVLVVEDNSDLLALAESMLNDLGYRVLIANDGKSALSVLDEAADIDLLLTDVMMPGGMNGPALAEEVVARRNNIKILYMSGYTKNAMPNEDIRGGDGEGVLLQKPFRKKELARMMRNALDK